MKLHLLAAAIGLALTANAQANTYVATLSGSLTADNAFSVYLSTSDDTLGDLLLSGNNWGTTYSFSNVGLLSGVNYYLHVVATNWDYETDGRYIDAGFLGSFDITGTEGVFGNATPHLVTNTSNWTVRAAGSDWAAPTETPVADGSNGVQPWGYHSGIDSSAEWIWHSSTQTTVAWFSTPILAAVPEPSSYALLLAGVAVLGIAARRSRKSS